MLGSLGVFQILDSSGVKVWQSSETTVGITDVLDVLSRGEVWKRTARIPLMIGGTPLAPGRYTLEATLSADVSIGARTSFLVPGSPPVTPGPTL